MLFICSSNKIDVNLTNKHHKRRAGTKRTQNSTHLLILFYLWVVFSDWPTLGNRNMCRLYNSEFKSLSLGGEITNVGHGLAFSSQLAVLPASDNLSRRCHNAAARRCLSGLLSSSFLGLCLVSQWLCCLSLHLNALWPQLPHLCHVPPSHRR